MAVLTAILTHLEAPAVRNQIEYLQELAPGSRFVVCYGGRHEEYERLDGLDALFIDDPTLRVPHHDRSYLGLLRTLYDERVRGEDVELVYLVEYDHLILSADFEARLVALAGASDAGLFGKTAGPRNDTNWPHFTRHRHDPELAEFISRISRRDDPSRRYGCLGTGMLFRRDTFEALAAVENPPQVYWELIVPTIVHHLGFDVADVDAFGDLYLNLRWQPEFSVDEALAAKDAGLSFIHPVKDPAVLESLREVARAAI